MRRTTSALLASLLCILYCQNLLAMGDEDFGEKPLSEHNYKAWPNIMPLLNHGGRVYHYWVNGNEQFCYAGDADSLNDALKDFVDVEAEMHEVVVRPGPGVAKSFQGRETKFNWDVHIVGGISGHLSKLEKGDRVWGNSPVLSIYVGGDIELSKIMVPKELTVIELSDLKKRWLEAMESKDKTVRGWSMGELASLDPYDDESMNAIAKKLEDADDWVRTNAAGALSIFGKKAESVLPKLREAMKTEDEGLKNRVEETIEIIEKADDTSDAQREHDAMLKQISEWRAAHFPRKP